MGCKASPTVGMCGPVLPQEGATCSLRVCCFREGLGFFFSSQLFCLSKFLSKNEGENTGIGSVRCGLLSSVRVIRFVTL